MSLFRRQKAPLAPPEPEPELLEIAEGNVEHFDSGAEAEAWLLADDVPPDPEPEPDPEPVRYDGPRCWVHQDWYGENPDGTFTKTHEAGWHYSTKQVVVKHRSECDPGSGLASVVKEWEDTLELPDQKLHLNDDDPADMFYELALPHHKSWVEKHGLGNTKAINPLPFGESHPAEAFDHHPLHQEWLNEVTARG